MEGAVRAHGLDPAIGHLHEDRTRTPSLPLDLMEPFRPACDRFAVKLASLGVLRTANHFESRDDGGVHLNSEGRRAFFPAWEEEMERSFPGTDGQTTTLRRAPCIYLDALENDASPSFFSLIADLEEDSLVAVPVCAACEAGIQTAGQLVRPDTKEVYVL